MSNKIIKLPKTKSLTGLSRSTIYNRISENRFPRQVNLGGRSVGWVESEVLEWIDKRIVERDGGRCNE